MKRMKKKLRVRLGVALRQYGALVLGGTQTALAAQVACGDQALELPAGDVSGLMPDSMKLARAIVAGEDGQADPGAALAVADFLDPSDRQSAGVWVMFALFSIIGVTMMGFGIFVAPAFKDLFRSFGADLPGLTLFMLYVAEWFMAPLGLAMVVLLIGFSVGTRLSGKLARLFDSIVSRVPLLGHSTRVLHTKRLVRWLAGTWGRAELRKLVAAAREVSEPGAFTRALEDVESRLASGASAGVAVRGMQWQPGLSRLLDSTEVSRDSLRAYAQTLDAKSDALIARLMLVSQLLAGLLVGITVIALYLPIFKMGSAI